MGQDMFRCEDDNFKNGNVHYIFSEGKKVESLERFLQSVFVSL